MKCRKISQDFEDSKLELARLEHMIKLQQDGLADANKELEAAARRRNFLYAPPNFPGSEPESQTNVRAAYRGIQLLEQEEALLSYSKQASEQDAAVAQRGAELETVEKEARELRLAIVEEKRQIDLRKKEVLQEKRLEGEIATLQIEVRGRGGQTHPDI